MFCGCFQYRGPGLRRRWKRSGSRPPDQDEAVNSGNILQGTEVTAKQFPITPIASGGHESNMGRRPSTSSSGASQPVRERCTNWVMTNTALPPPDRSSSHRTNSQYSTLSPGNLTNSEKGPELTTAVNVNRDSADDDSGGHMRPKKTLRDELCDARIEWPEGSFRYFIAVDDLNQLITADSISAELRSVEFSSNEAPKELVDKILKFAQNLFAILVCLERGDHIVEFLKEGIDDTDLPFVRSDKTAKPGHFKLCSKKTPDRPIRCMSDWDQTSINDFGRDQWLSLAPIFEYDDDIKHYELDDNCVLPWVEDDERSDRAIESGFGSVWKIAIHPAHQRIHRTMGPKRFQFVALKQLHLKDEQSFKSEVEMLKILGRREHTHLVSLLATFRLKGRYYLLFPYANCNLREYWERTPLPDFSESTVSWTLSQCKAMASALHNIHEYKATHAFSLSDASSSDANDSSSEDEAPRYGRHGDIKAENILWFLEEATDERGHLVIADFGLTAFHKKTTRSEVNAGHITGTPSYEGPEFVLHSKISRAIDIWSLGCLYLEFVTWLVGGWEHLKRFPDARIKQCEPEMIDDTFFTIVNGEHRAVVRQSVKDWMEDLHEMPRCSAFVHELLNFISEQLLVVIPQDRAKIAVLNAELGRMIRKGESDPLYLTAPVPTPRRPQIGLKPLSPAPVVWSGLTRAPNPNEGEPLPGRSSTASATEVSLPPQTGPALSAL